MKPIPPFTILGASLFIFALTACTTPIEAPGHKGQQLPTAGEHLPPPDFSEPEKSTSEDKQPLYLHYKIEDNCGTNGATGSYRLQPEACYSIYEPVCGCDGKTYGNACAANSNGVSAMSKGECKI